MAGAEAEPPEPVVLPESPPPPAPLYLRSFLREDYSRACRRRFYCFTCPGPVCLHCCMQHGVHHPAGVKTAEVRLLRETPAISAQEVKGVGYDWTMIQRLKDGSEYFIPLRRLVYPATHTMPLDCVVCHDRMYQKATFCSTFCRVGNVVDGRGRPMIQALVATDFGPVDPVDTFCTRCQRLFCLRSCPDHIQAHHPDQPQAHLIHILREQGLVLAIANDLPHSVTREVQEITVNGEITVPVLRQPEQDLDVEIGSLCLTCMRLIGAGFNYCSIQCRAAGIWQL